jgi:hypothetical protein
MKEGWWWCEEGVWSPGRFVRSLAEQLLTSFLVAVSSLEKFNRHFGERGRSSLPSPLRQEYLSLSRRKLEQGTT